MVKTLAWSLYFTCMSKMVETLAWSLYFTCMSKTEWWRHLPEVCTLHVCLRWWRHLPEVCTLHVCLTWWRHLPEVCKCRASADEQWTWSVVLTPPAAVWTDYSLHSLPQWRSSSVQLIELASTPQTTRSARWWWSHGKGLPFQTQDQGTRIQAADRGNSSGELGMVWVENQTACDKWWDTDMHDGETGRRCRDRWRKSPDQTLRQQAATAQCNRTQLVNTDGSDLASCKVRLLIGNWSSYCENKTNPLLTVAHKWYASSKTFHSSLSPLPLHKSGVGLHVHSTSKLWSGSGVKVVRKVLDEACHL